MSRIVDLRQYDVVFTTSFFYKHGVSGHMYELIDYYLVCTDAGMNCGILLADGVDKTVFNDAIRIKYNLTNLELEQMMEHTHQCHKPLIIRAQNVCIVDGSWRILDCVLYADNVFLLRCSEDDFSYFSNNKTIGCAHVMQDFKLYPERFEDLNLATVDYVKKILWSRYRAPAQVKTNTGLFYLTTNCRAVTADFVQNVIDKQICDKYLIVTNEVGIYKSLESDSVQVMEAPIENIFDYFDTYIYTPTDLQADCSPRFIVECAVFGKHVEYEIDYVCAGVERRKQDISENLNQLELTTDDEFIRYVKNAISN